MKFIGEPGERTIDFVSQARYLVRDDRPDRSSGAPAELLFALHGQGMTAESFLHILRFLPPAPGGRLLVVPEGPYPFEMRRDRAAGERGVGHSWYIYRGDQADFRAHLERTERHLLRVLDEVANSYAVDRARSVLLGYSQGGYIGGFLALRHPEWFRGLVLASTRLKSEFLEAELSPRAHRALPSTLAIYSEQDPSLPIERMTASLDELRAAGADVETFLHGEGHMLPPAALQEMGNWLSRKGFHGQR